MFFRMLYLIIRKMKENEVLENMEKLTKRQQDILDFIKLKVQEKDIHLPYVKSVKQSALLLVLQCTDIYHD